MLFHAHPTRPPDSRGHVKTREQARAMRLGYRQRDGEDATNSPVVEDMPKPVELVRQLITDTHRIALSTPPYGARLRS